MKNRDVNLYELSLDHANLNRVTDVRNFDTKLRDRELSHLLAKKHMTELQATQKLRDIMCKKAILSKSEFDVGDEIEYWKDQTKIKRNFGWIGRGKVTSLDDRVATVLNNQGLHKIAKHECRMKGPQNMVVQGMEQFTDSELKSTDMPNTHETHEFLLSQKSIWNVLRQSHNEVQKLFSAVKKALKNQNQVWITDMQETANLQELNFLKDTSAQIIGVNYA